MYTRGCDQIINKGKLELFNDSNFTKNVVMHVSPSDLAGIDSATAYHNNYIRGISSSKMFLLRVTKW